MTYLCGYYIHTGKSAFARRAPTWGGAAHRVECDRFPAVKLIYPLLVCPRLEVMAESLHDKRPAPPRHEVGVSNNALSD